MKLYAFCALIAFSSTACLAQDVQLPKKGLIEYTIDNSDKAIRCKASTHTGAAYAFSETCTETVEQACKQTSNIWASLVGIGGYVRVAQKGAHEVELAPTIIRCKYEAIR